MPRKKSSSTGTAKEAKKPKKNIAPPEKVHLNAKVDKDLLKKMKVHCAVNEIKIQDFLADAIRKAIKGAEGK